MKTTEIHHRTIFLLLLAILIFRVAESSSNMLCDGGFEEYGLVPGWGGFNYQYYPSNYSCWYNLVGGIVEVKIVNSMTSSMVDLAHDYPYVLCQDVPVLIGALYQLNFTVFNEKQVVSSNIFVILNGNHILNHATLNPYNITKASVTFVASTTSAQICFNFTAVLSPQLIKIAPCLDNITLTQLSSPSNQTIQKDTSTSISTTSTQLSQQIIRGVALLMSFPMKLVVSLRCAYLLVDDLWLYYYSDRNYTGLIRTTFQTISNIQLLKFQYLEKYIGWEKYKSKLGISDYSQYSYTRFVQIQGTSSVFLDSNFPFLMYTVPQNTLLSLTLYVLFLLLHNFRISKFIRKFYFIKCVLLVAMLEQNLAYFVYVCFSHLKQAFYFRVHDKIAMIFTIGLLFCLVGFCFCFYLLVGQYLGKKAVYFAEITHTESAGFVYKTLKFLIRNFLRATILSLCQSSFAQQIMLVSAVEAAMLMLTILLQSWYQVFRSKTMYCLNVVYCFLFILLNFCMLVDGDRNGNGNGSEQGGEVDMVGGNWREVFVEVKQVEEIVIYCLVGNTVLMMLLDLMALSWAKLLTIQQFQKEFNKSKKEEVQLSINNKSTSRNIKPRPIMKSKDNNHKTDCEIDQDKTIPKIKLRDNFVSQVFKTNENKAETPQKTIFMNFTYDPDKPRKKI